MPRVHPATPLPAPAFSPAPVAASDSLVDALQRRFGATPWWTFSVMMHLALLAAAAIGFAVFNSTPPPQLNLCAGLPPLDTHLDTYENDGRQNGNVSLGLGRPDEEKADQLIVFDENDSGEVAQPIPADGQTGRWCAEPVNQTEFQLPDGTTAMIVERASTTLPPNPLVSGGCAGASVRAELATTPTRAQAATRSAMSQIAPAMGLLPGSSSTAAAPAAGSSPCTCTGCAQGYPGRCDSTHCGHGQCKCHCHCCDCDG